MRNRIALAAAVAAVVFPAAALAAGPSRVFFEDTVPSGGSSSITIVIHRSAAFEVLLRVPTAGKAKLFLLGRNAPKGGPLIQTSNASPTAACEGAAGSFYCKASFEPLPKGTYTWRLSWVSAMQQGPRMPAHVELTVRW
jgi:hypothetical protein